MRLPVLHADTDPDNRSEHGSSSATGVKTPSILQFHPGPQKGTLILEIRLEYELSSGHEEWHKNLYNVQSVEPGGYCAAIRQANINIQKNFALQMIDVGEHVIFNEITFTGHIFCYHDLPIPTEEEEAELVARIKAYACKWLKTTMEQYQAILAKVEKIPETPWRLSHS